MTNFQTNISMVSPLWNLYPDQLLEEELLFQQPPASVERGDLAEDTEEGKDLNEE